MSRNRQLKRKMSNAKNQRDYLVKIGKGLGYTWAEMRERFIWPEGKGFGTSQVEYNDVLKRYVVRRVEYQWNLDDLIAELEKIKKHIPEAEDKIWAMLAMRWTVARLKKARRMRMWNKVTYYLYRWTKNFR